jgi:hypothetical protein
MHRTLEIYRESLYAIIDLINSVADTFENTEEDRENFSREMGAIMDSYAELLEKERDADGNDYEGDV